MPAVARVRAVATLIAVLGASILGLVSPPAQAAGDSPDRAAAAQPEPSAGVYEFDIPALPLAEALRRYNDLTQRSVFYETSLVVAKTSAALRGRYSAESALTQLLAGTGLDARFVNRRSAMLTAAPVAEAAVVAPPAAAGPDPAMQQHYDGQVQVRIAQALCANPAIEAGRYRIALRFWVNDDQRIGQIRVRVADRPELEPAVLAALAGFPIGTPPPGMAQPTVVIISPEAARRYGGCRS